MNIFKHENCWEFVKELEDNSVDCIATDPPYMVTSNEWDKNFDIERFWQEFGRVIKPNGAIVMTAIQPFSSQIVVSKLNWYKYEWIWEKTLATGFVFAKYQPMRSHEHVLVFSKKTPIYNPQKTKAVDTYRKNGRLIRPNEKTSTYGITRIAGYSKDDGTRYPKSILKYNSTNSGFKEIGTSLHPTQKPVPLFEYLIRTYTNEGDTVLDPFGGSGTTAVACIRTKRNFITYEQDSTYFETMKKRIELEQTKITLF